MALNLRRTMILSSFIAIILIVILISVRLRWNSNSPSVLPKPTLVRVAQWGQERYLIYLPLYVAMEEKLFEREGLAATISFTGNDDQTFAAVAGGSADFGIGDPAFAAISHAKGFPARVIGTVVGGVAIWGVTNQKNLKVLQRPEDLAGLRIGTFPAPSTNYTLMRDLEASLPAALPKPTIVQAAIGAQLGLLESGAADIAMVLEPAASVAESQGYRVVYSSPKFHGPFSFTGVTTTEDVLRAKGDVAAKFIKGLQQAMRDCRSQPFICERVAKKLFPDLSPDVTKRAIARMISENTFPESVVVDPAAWQKALKVRVEVGDLESLEKADGVVDNRFAEAAASSGGQE